MPNLPCCCGVDVPEADHEFPQGGNPNPSTEDSSADSRPVGSPYRKVLLIAGVPRVPKSVLRFFTVYRLLPELETLLMRRS